MGKMDDPTGIPREKQAREFRQIQRVTVEELLEELEQLHERLAEVYRQAGNNALDERAALLLQYLEGHERWVRETLEDFEANASQQILQAWSRYARNVPVDQLIERTQIDPSATADEITRVTSEMSDFLIGALESIAESAAAPQVEDALRHLRDVEERAKIEALRGADQGMT